MFTPLLWAFPSLILQGWGRGIIILIPVPYFCVNTLRCSCEFHARVFPWIHRAFLPCRSPEGLPGTLELHLVSFMACRSPATIISIIVSAGSVIFTLLTPHVDLSGKALIFKDFVKHEFCPRWKIRLSLLTNF